MVGYVAVILSVLMMLITFIKRKSISGTSGASAHPLRIEELFSPMSWR